MAEAHGFKYDIIISYTHNDNSPIGNQPGWVVQFHNALENWLTKRRGFKQLKIWRDKELSGNTLFNEEIKETIGASALFFALHSRNYPESEYCMKELNWFHELNSERHRDLLIGSHHRIFNILLNNIHHSKWPKALGKTSGFPMHDAQKDELGDFISPNDPNFEKRLRKIVDAVETILQAFPKVPAEMEPPKSEERPVTIFMSYVADSLQDFRERVVIEAASQNAAVLQEIPPPRENASHAKAVKSALAQAAVSIHLLDGWPGRKIVDHKETTYPREQLQLALDSPAQKLIWVPGDLTLKSIDDEGQRNFINELATGERKAGAYEFVQGSRTDFINLLRDKIAALQQPAANGQTEFTFLVDTHQKDQRYAFKLADFLAGHGVLVDFNLEFRNPDLSLTKFEESLWQVQNLIILFGKVSPSWLRARINKAFKIISEKLQTDGAFPLKNIWVYRVPGNGQGILLPDFHPLVQKMITVLDNSHSEGIDPEIAARLLAQPGAGGTA